MKISTLIAASATIALAACGTSGGNSSAPAAPVAGAPAPTGTAWTDTVTRTPEGGMLMGNPNAALKLVEYGSRSCPHCGKFDAEGFPALKSGYIASGKVSYEFRDYPVHGPLDLAPILLGHCVEPATFFPLLDQMFQSQEQLLGNADKLDQTKAQALSSNPGALATFYAEGLGYLDFVKQRGVPDAKARACLVDGAAIQAIADHTKTANDKYKVAGTPTFILNGQVLENVGDWATLEPALKARGA